MTNHTPGPAGLLRAHADLFRRQATNAPRDSEEQLVAREVADILDEVIAALEEAA